MIHLCSPVKPVSGEDLRIVGKIAPPTLPSLDSSLDLPCFSRAAHRARAVPSESVGGASTLARSPIH